MIMMRTVHDDVDKVKRRGRGGKILVLRSCSKHERHFIGRSPASGSFSVPMSRGIQAPGLEVIGRYAALV